MEKEDGRHGRETTMSEDDEELYHLIRAVVGLDCDSCSDSEEGLDAFRGTENNSEGT
jgi:hypothetical protein